MTDNVRKIFEILGVEPNEEFKINGYDRVFYFDKELNIHFHFNQDLNLYSENDEWMDISLQSFINGTNKIIKLPKEPKKKKLRDLTKDEWDKWKRVDCAERDSCENCLFKNVACNRSDNEKSWFNHKYLYSDAFLNKEIEVEE